MSSYRIKSMTGFGRAQTDTSRGQFVVEVRTVNNRYFDLSLSLPREMTLLESPLRTLLKQAIQRGKMDLRVRFTPNETQQPEVKLNLPLARLYIEQLGKLREAGASGEIPLSLVAGLPGVLESSAAEFDEQVMWRYMRTAVEQAIEALNRERSREGLAIGEQLRELAAQLRALVARVDERRGEIVTRLRDRMTQRIDELLAPGGNHLEAGRLEQEVALLADRADVSEEIVRLQAHLERFEQLLRNRDDDAVGKNIDFLLQEINREVNTLGSKARETDLTALTLEMKSVAEKMREQIQNVE